MSQLATALAQLAQLAAAPTTVVTHTTPKHIQMQTLALRIKVYAELTWNHNTKVTAKQTAGRWEVTAHKPEMALALEQYYTELNELTKLHNVSFAVQGNNLQWIVE